MADTATLAPVIPEGAPHVLFAINGVMADIAKEGIAKGRKNEQQGYKFRGIDDVYNALAPILAKNKLVITPRCLSRDKQTVQTAKGGTLFYVTVEVEFELSSAIDGTSRLARMYGEAMDSGDKATNKAMSAAYKYMAMQEFCIPTEGDNDADGQTHEIIVPSQQQQQAAARAAEFVARARTALNNCDSLPALKEKYEGIRSAPGWAKLNPVDQNTIVQEHASLAKVLGKQAPSVTDVLNGDEIPF